MPVTRPNSVEEYISGFPVDVQKTLEKIRSTIIMAIPQATECISYGMPTYKLERKTVIHFAAHRNHIGLYPVPTDTAFDKEFLPYKTSGKGTIQFPFAKPIPYDLIVKITKFRVEKITGKQ